MELERYFTFLDPDDIRIQGTRIGIETVLDDYLNGVSPEEMVTRYPSLTLEQICATITYYLHNKTTVDAYLARWRAYCNSSWEEWQRNSAPFVQEMRDRLQQAREQVLAEKGPEYLVSSRQ